VLAAVVAVGFFAITLVAGFVLFRRALDDNRPSVASVVNVPTKVGLLFSYDEPSDVVNHIVFFNDVHLEPGPTDELYYAVGAAGNRVLVMSKGAKNSTDNAQVDIRGTVRTIPAVSILKKKWKLTSDELKAAREQGIYIEADTISARRPVAAKVARK
jgi:hypothetical protein